ncbi:MULTISPECIES: pyocin activator PrtN family protein [unclassified Pseudomonas]|uniref:pyocin activator PrtN family protein n=1 Tax=unclassified Pseudomonas TaxID=196821 RepID=UPI00244AFF32|nr:MULTISPECIES: pyocin activator PrtN family protein [unclassified Pseudomonas]MDG9925464.1 pyocin activator PrtN family protein [Pseudomonas sp. GD04045]MDH0034095.1 pyocin activator PrtN family protein [Pseudomonas sp. GD04019]
MSQEETQKALRLQPAPRATTIELLFRQFGSVLIPVEAARATFFRYLSEETFKPVPGTDRLPIPVTTLEDGNRAIRYFEIHHLAAHIEHRAGMADAKLEKALTQPEPEAT